MASTGHSAVGSLTGYLYQVRVALWLAYERLYEDSSLLVGLEMLDDVHFESAGSPSPPELLQTKHHSTPANLTDKSEDLWKTLGIWLERDEWIQAAERYCLLTTAVAEDESAASYLRVSKASRDTGKAYEKLLVAARESKAAGTAPARKLFASRSRADIVALLNNVFVLDGAPSIEDLDAELRRQFRSACPQKDLQTFVEYLEGWWYARVLSQLRGGQLILAEEIEAEVTQLRQQFLLDALPIHRDILATDEALFDAEVYRNRIFVTQLEVAGISEPRILKAIVDFYKASEQRSRWLREELVMVGELGDYERKLVDEWDRYFQEVAEDYGDEASEDQKGQAARAVFNWTQQENPSLRIRPRCEDPFIQRGSFQILADDLRVGWHPDFKLRVAKALGATSG